ncbi:MAG: glucose-6-phosphate isomerase [Alphaproteobacteria bacterium]|nr:glucose-6-phosphate isomerase [Alphaproteobacteria bacterium]
MAGLTQLPEWQNLLRHRDALKSSADVILNDPQRLDNCEIALDGLRLNYALHQVTPETISLLVKLAEAQKLAEWRSRMLNGEKVNSTESRAVLHTALRQTSDAPVKVDGKDVIPEIRAVRKRMADFVENVRSGQWKGATGKSIRHIVNIGIGGSDLGPRLAVQALAPYASKLQVHFAANADAFDLLATLKNIDPAETLFVVVSKTFTTQETLLNAQTARQWLTAKLGDKAVAQHFVAVSTNAAETAKFGIPAANMFPMWDWVGGRFSLWSAVGLSVALGIGMENFDAMLSGAAAMDEHFKNAPLARNMPVLLALLGIWQRNFMGAGALAILPYSERLRELPRYLQQLEMESNGKSVSRDGKTVDYETAPAIFGDCGTISQHSFHQWLHQGTGKIPADFIGIMEDDLNQPTHHRALLANMAAQACALAFGNSQAAAPQDMYVGERSSTLIMLDRLDPKHFGMLLALYEHKVFTQGILWNINSFDQPGVDLGKKMARGLEAPTGAASPSDGFLASLHARMGQIGKK